MNEKIILECPNCHCDLTIDGNYEEDYDDQVVCLCCKWTSSKFTFDYIGGVSDHEQEE